MHLKVGSVPADRLSPFLSLSYCPQHGGNHRHQWTSQMLVKRKDGTWTASANLRGRLYLHRGIERTYTRDLLVEVFLDGRGNGLNH
ncbi:TPA: hypothetical protein JW570_002921 [Escherichia coli]|uniref:hypothetical protein n=1 Tax=Escherichia coli TaxID=562 RepID=UPI0015616373|nr:hypothetical protein [Escherichia coli]HAX2108344.1 hypothetical protein [Escherichia coli]